MVVRAGLTMLALLAFLRLPARADEPRIWVEAIPYAHHWNDASGYQFNSNLRGLAILAPLDPSGDLEAFYMNYQNSFYNPTNMVGMAWTPLTLGPVKLGVIGAITNYKAYPFNRYKPFVGGFEATIGLGRSGRVRLDIIVLPCGGSFCSVATAVGIRFGIGNRK